MRQLLGHPIAFLTSGFSGAPTARLGPHASGLLTAAVLAQSSSSEWGTVWVWQRRPPWLVASILAIGALGNVAMLVGWMAESEFVPLLCEGVSPCGCLDSALGRGLVASPCWMHGECSSPRRPRSSRPTGHGTSAGRRAPSSRVGALDGQVEPRDRHEGR